MTKAEIAESSSWRLVAVGRPLPASVMPRRAKFSRIRTVPSVVECRFVRERYLRYSADDLLVLV